MRRHIALLGLLAFACNMSPPDALEGPQAFDVRLAPGQDLGETTPLPFSETDGVELDMTVSPVGGGFDGWVTVRCEPGRVDSITGLESSGPHVRLALAEGEEASLSVTITLAFGVSRIWVEDVGYLPTTSPTPACDDGVDNDEDGYRDHTQDPGCVDETDGSEQGGTYIVGASGPIVFQNPRISDVQGSGILSPLEGRTVLIDRGRLVVTRISTEGFYVTDIAADAPVGGANSLFVYNYNTPWHLRECDVITNLSGIVGEFLACYTELQFPSWDVIDPEGRVAEPTSRDECPIPDPVVLDSSFAGSDWDMEPLEAGFVRVVDGRIGAEFRDCDFDDDGQISWPGPEDDCASDCGDDAECTELTQYFDYGQYSVVLDGCRGSDCVAVFAVSKDTNPSFWADHHADEVIPAITGTLHHLYFIRPEWIVETGCSDDLVLSGSPLPTWEACVPPYARGEHYDDN